MRLNIYHILFIGVILLGSCKPKGGTLESLSLGSYVGVSPCSNCRGVYARVVFLPDGCVRMSSDPDDYNALQGRNGHWEMGNDSIICANMGRDTLYFRYLSSENIMSVYKNREYSNQLKDGYLLRKDTI